MKQFISFFVLVGFLAACNSNPAPTVPSPNPSINTTIVVPTNDAAATETTVTQRILATLTASAPQPTTGATITAPPLPTQLQANAPTVAPPTIGIALSPSVTPIPKLPTRPPTLAPTRVPSRAPTQISQESLRGKILFKSARAKGKYPNQFQFFVMDADGGNVQPVNRQQALALYQQLKPLEGFSPDKSLVVLGERTCVIPNTCNLYVGELAVISRRSQGQWVTSRRGERADKPVWSPDGTWIAFLWNRGNDKAKNIFKGIWSEQNQDYKQLTDFPPGKDTQDSSYSPDGSSLAFATQDGPRWQIWTLNALAENPTDAAAHNLSNSEFDDWDPLWIK